MMWGEDEQALPHRACLGTHAVVDLAAGQCTARGTGCTRTNTSGVCVVPALGPGEVLTSVRLVHHGRPATVVYTGTPQALWLSCLQLITHTSKSRHDGAQQSNKQWQ